MSEGEQNRCEDCHGWCGNNARRCRGCHLVWLSVHMSEIIPVKSGESHPSWNGGWKNALPKCVVCGVGLMAYSATHCKEHMSTGDKSYKWKGGLPKCIDCGTQLARYKAKRCRKCRGLNMRNLDSFTRGDRLTIYKKVRQCANYKDWKNRILQRDGFYCQQCGEEDRLEVNHVVPFNELLRMNDIVTIEDAYLCDSLWDDNNGITLCHRCHKKIQRHENEYIEHFKILIKYSYEKRLTAR